MNKKFIIGQEVVMIKDDLPSIDKLFSLRKGIVEAITHKQTKGEEKVTVQLEGMNGNKDAERIFYTEDEARECLLRRLEGWVEACRAFVAELQIEERAGVPIHDGNPLMGARVERGFRAVQDFMLEDDNE